MEEIKEQITCGIIMPISTINDYTAEHWVEVKEMIERSVSMINKYAMKASLVSNSDESHIIHNTIMGNVYSNEIVVCDVSGKNPNVMFELGLRIAFGKPIIIIKDEKTKYSFDTGNIEHIEYHSGLSYNSVDKFQSRLKEKIISTYESSIKDNYVPLIKQFGNFKLEELPTQKISTEKYLMQINTLNEQILSEIRKIKYSNRGLSKEQIGNKFIDDFILENDINPNNIIGHIDAIVRASTQDSNLLSMFRDNEEELEKNIANLILKRL